MTASPRGAGEGDTCAAALPTSELTWALLEALDQPILACDPGGRTILVNAAARRLGALANQPATGSAVREAMPLREEDGRELAPGAHPLERALNGEATVARLSLPTGARELRRVQVSARRLHGADERTLGALMTIWSAERDSSDERLRNYASDIDILTEVSRLLSELHDPDDAAGIVCMVATGATGAIGVLLWGASGGELTVRCHESAVDPALLPLLVEMTRGAALRALSGGAPVIKRHETISDDFPCGLSWHEPLITAGHSTGVLTILWPGVLEDLERPRSLIGLLGHHAATALERADLLRRLHVAARTDALTGVANRRVWQESLDRELARVRRTEQPLSLVLIDVDHFKAYNDRFGHPAGDGLLRDTAQAWAAQLRGADLLARTGGEEFAVMLPDCDLEGALAVAERLRTSMPHGQTCSLGVVTSDGRATAWELYSTADAALYRAKQSGRNRIEVAPALPADARAAA